jgi:molecular chaperone GrpE (heat shock protein)
LTEDFKKAEQLWVDAKKKSEANKTEVIRGFAATLVPLNTHFINTKQIETEAHSVDLREGFDNTVRLFFNTLEKFNIKKVDIKEGSKVKKDQVIIAKEEKSEAPEQKGTVAKVLEEGWEVEGKTIIKPKVVVYN